MELFIGLVKQEGGDPFGNNDSNVTYFGQNVFLLSYSSAKAWATKCSEPEMRGTVSALDRMKIIM